MRFVGKKSEWKGLIMLWDKRGRMKRGTIRRVMGFKGKGTWRGNLGIVRERGDFIKDGTQMRKSHQVLR